MAKKLIVRLQNPTIELIVEAKDGSGEVAKLTVGYKRYEVEESGEKLKALSKLFENQDENSLASDDFLRNEILYLKHVLVDVFDEETGKKDSEIKIPDTRSAVPNSFWGTAEECLSVLVDHYLSSAPWKEALYSGLFKALSNRSFEEGKVKN